MEMYDKEHVAELRKHNLLVFTEPNQVRIEFVRGCNLNCSFCGRSQASTGRITKETLLNIVDNLTEKTKRISISLQGEPTLHKNVGEYIGIIREKMPKAQILIITNTEVYKSKNIFEFIDLFDKGLNYAQTDFYSKAQRDFFIGELERNKRILEIKGIQVYDYYKDNVNAFSYKGYKHKTIILTDESDIFNCDGNVTRRMHNWGGNLKLSQWEKYTGSKLQDFPLRKVCKEPYKYMTIGYDGIVDICCSNGAKCIDLGNVNEEHVLDIWQGEKFQKVRALLAEGYREDLISCVLCSQRSFRVGLYPYWGKEYFYGDCIHTVEKIQKLHPKEPLYNNLIEFSKIGKLKPHISKLIKE